MTIRTDPKIDRIMHSWLAAEHDAAAWLANLADEIVVRQREPLTAGAFSYLAIDHARAGSIAAPGTAPLDVTCPTTVLVLPTPLLHDAAERIPVITDAWANSLATSTPVVVLGPVDA